MADNKLKQYGEDMYDFGKSMYNSAKGLVSPDPSIDEGLMEKEQNVADYKDASNKPSTTLNPVATHPLGNARYGDKEGEQRINTNDMTKPLGVAYHDVGGELDPDKVNVVGENGPEAIVGDEVIPNDKLAEAKVPTNPAEQQPREASAMGSAMSVPTEEQDVEKAERERQREQISQDKKVAASKGDLVGLGLANIHEKEVDKKDPQKQAAEAAVAAPQTGTTSAAPTPATGGPLQELGSANQIKTKQDLETKRAELKQQMLSPDEVISGTARRQLAELDSQNPYGSAANHPGTLGKIEHGLAKAGNIAGDIFAPGTTALIPGTDLNRQVQENRGEEEVKAGEANRVAEADVKQKEALAKLAGIGKTNNERVFQSLMHGGENGAPQINPRTGNPWTEQDALLESQGTGKTPEEEYVQSQMKETNPDTGKPFTRQEATQDYLLMAAGTKPLRASEKRVQDYLKANNLEDTPANRDAASVALKRRDTETTQEAQLPFSEQKAKFNSNLEEERTRLSQIQADALLRGKSADDLQAKEDQRSAKVMATIEAAQDALANSKDHDQFAASIVPVVATMAVSDAEGIKRLNPTELKKFSPESGSLYRWAEAHADKFLAGDIPDEYRNEVGHMLSRIEAAEKAENLINTSSIDNTIRHGGTEPVVNKKTGTPTKTKASTEQAPSQTGHKVGDVIVQGGKSYKATKVDENGKVVRAKEVEK